MTRRGATASSPPGFLELFQGKAGLSHWVHRVCQEHVVTHSIPNSELYFANLGDDSMFEKLLAQARSGAFLWVHAAPPCKTFSSARRSDQWGTAKVLRTAARPEGFGDPAAETGNLYAKRTIAIAEVLVSIGAVFSIENPLKSLIWELN